MAGPVSVAATAQSSSVPRYGPALALLTTLFFMWGFISVINGTLLPHLRSVFELNYFQTTLTEWIWFIGYLVASIPAAFLIEKIGYQRTPSLRSSTVFGMRSAPNG
jgi:FHS family L-fucose permease-like MFS transporter